MEMGHHQDIPSDTQAFHVYNHVLEHYFGHSLHPNDLVATVQHHGGTLLAQGPSDWKIDPRRHEYLWKTMMYFFGVGMAPELQSQNYNAAQWIQRAWNGKPKIQASNVDILMELPFIGKWDVQQAIRHNVSPHDNKRKSDTDKYSEIEFTSPNNVAFVPRQRCTLQPGEIRIQSRCSLISSGTELKIFTGSFDDAALDVNLESMEGQRMQYPMAYGYSLVGEVVEAGEGVDLSRYQNRLVFTFSPHASEVVVPADTVQIVPRDIDPFDAIFMPSIETAISIIHDAAPKLGEQVCVFGQGLIGLLVTALLSSMLMNVQRPTLTTVDTIPERLALSALLGSQQAILPAQVSACEKFDVAIEASANPRALQSAIDHTRNGGRVIVASWYGNKPLEISLGIEFHRSHKTIVTSQVSELPAHLRETWSKQRRFDLAWRLLKQIHPARLLTRIATPDDAQQAYLELLNGKQVAVAFDYFKKA
jgi:threonine dehydrogenase-like Zn-dependent dehydrogenase